MECFDPCRLYTTRLETALQTVYVKRSLYRAYCWRHVWCTMVGSTLVSRGLAVSRPSLWGQSRQALRLIIIYAKLQPYMNNRDTNGYQTCRRSDNKHPFYHFNMGNHNKGIVELRCSRTCDV